MNRATTREASSGSQPSPIVTGRVLRGRDFSLLVQPRALLVIGILLAVAVLLALIGLTQGKVAVPLGDIIPPSSATASGNMCSPWGCGCRGSWRR